MRQFAKAIGVSRGAPWGRDYPQNGCIFKMAAYFGKNPDELLAMVDRVAADVLAIIIKQPAYARFVRTHVHLTKDQLDVLARQLRAFQDQK